MGRPSRKDKIDIELLKRLAEQGLTDKEIGYVLGVSRASISNYKKDPEFKKMLDEGKEFANHKVVQALYKRAIGYDISETKVFKVGGKILKRQIKKNVLPDPKCIEIWLYNRDRENWRQSNRIEFDNVDNKEPFSITVVTSKEKKGGE